MGEGGIELVGCTNADLVPVIVVDGAAEAGLGTGGLKSSSNLGITLGRGTTAGFV